MLLRYILLFAVIANSFFTFVCRNSLYVSIVSMVSANATTTNFSSKDHFQCPTKTHAKATNQVQLIKGFDWTTAEVNMILSAYYLTYTLFSLFLGVVVEYVSPSITLLLAKLVHGCLHFITPFVAYYGAGYVTFVRLLMGVSAALSYPATFALLKRVAHDDELSTAANLSHAMSGFGCIAASFFTGWICSATQFGGWKMSFYSSGGVEILYVVVLSLFLKTLISFEKNYRDSILQNERDPMKFGKAQAKWKLFFDWKVYGLAYSYFAFGIIQRLTWMYVPQYLFSVMHFSIFENGLLSSVPLITFTITLLFSILVIGLLINHLSFNPRKVHSLFFTFFNVSAFLISLSTQYIGCNGIFAVLLFATWSFLTAISCTHVIAVVPHYDRHIGIVSGITNTFSNAPGILIPVIINAFTAQDIGNSENWVMAFITCGVLSVLGSIIFNMVLWINQTNLYLLGGGHYFNKNNL